MKDKDLIKGLKNKKRSALEKVIETYSAYVNVVVYNTIGNAMSKEDMEEVTMEVADLMVEEDRTIIFHYLVVEALVMKIL